MPPLFQQENTLWAATDYLGSVNQLLDNTGTVVEHREYESFGAVDTVYDSLGNTKTSDALLSHVAFAGRFWDDQAGLYNNRERWYDADTGRFIGEDPAEDGNNWYVYAGNNPITFFDPSGLAIASPLDNLGSFGSSSFSTNLLDTGFSNFAGPVAPSINDFNQSFSANTFNSPAPVRFADQFSNTSTVTDNGGRTRIVANIGSQQVAFDPRTGAETGELLNTLRGQGGTSFQTFATPEIARNLILLENPSTLELVDAATTVVGGGGAVRKFATGGLRAGLTATGIFAAEETFERATGLPSLNPVSLLRGRVGVSPSVARGMPKAFSGIKQASQFLQEAGVSRTGRVRILRSFEAGTVQFNAAGSNQFGTRFFGGKANEVGGFLFDTFPASRRSLGLRPEFNSMEGFRQFQIRPGAPVITGRAASQGAGFEGGQIQNFILNPQQNLIP